MPVYLTAPLTLAKKTCRIRTDSDTHAVMHVNHFVTQILYFLIRNEALKYLKIILVAVNCGTQSMRDMTVNYPFTLFLSPAISLDRYFQSQLIADIKSKIICSIVLEVLSHYVQVAVAFM